MGTTKTAGRGPGRGVAGIVLLLWAAALLAACGGTLEEGTGVQGASSGTVAGFGSVTVDGVRFDNNAADVVIGGVPGFSVDNLSVGMRVTVRGPINDAAKSGTAQTILVEREVVGPLDNNGIDNALNTLRVLGQTVTVNPGSWFRGFDNLFALQALQPDNGSRPSLEVHGLRDLSGELHATFVRLVADNAHLSDNVFLRGTIDNLNLGTRTFNIGAQRIDFGSPTLVKVNWPALGTLDNGDVVDVTGTLSGFGGAGLLSASRIEVDNAAIGRAGGRAKLDGYVVSVLPSSFSMNGPRGVVAVTAPGVIPAGGTVSAGARLLAEGTLSAGGLSATRLTVRRPNAALIEAAVTDVNAAQKSLTMVAKTVAADGLAEFQDDAAGPGLPKRTFGFADIAPASTIRVVGAFDTLTGKVSASRVERLAPGSPTPANLVTLQGPVSDIIIALPIFTILGGSVVTDLVNTDYFDKGHVPFTGPTAQSDFFDALRLLGTGTVVRARNGIASTLGGLRVDAAGPQRMEVEIVQVND